MFDRTYYRQMPDEYLIEKGKESGHELCIALAERLEDVGSVDDALADQQDTIDELRAELGEKDETIGNLESEIDDLRDALSEKTETVSRFESKSN
jgi:chromosome segregation ATPase